MRIKSQNTIFRRVLLKPSKHKRWLWRIMIYERRLLYHTVNHKKWMFSFSFSWYLALISFPHFVLIKFYHNSKFIEFIRKTFEFWELYLKNWIFLIFVSFFVCRPLKSSNPQNMSPNEHHHLPRFPAIGQKEKHPVKIPPPMCPRTEKAMLDW